MKIIKNIKKFVFVLIALVTSFCMIDSVHAENIGSIVVNGTTAGKTYEIYKKFGGKQEWNTAKINASVSIAGFLNGYTTLLQFFREFNF